MFMGWAVDAAEQRHIVFVTGDHEYGSESTMPLLAKELEKYGFKTTVLKAYPNEMSEENIPGLEALEKADMAVFYLRWRRLVPDQLEKIEKYVKSGKPVMSFRTTSHAFNFKGDHPNANWNKWFGSDVFGTPGGWGGDGHTHFGHESSTDVKIAPDAKNNPVLTGVAEEFHVRSWLYRVLPKWPPQDATVLLIGTAVKPNSKAEPNPVAWTWKNKFNGRSFYTSMGHPDDFQVEAFQRLLLNATHWCLDMPVPKDWKGKMDIVVSYDKPKK